MGALRAGGVGRISAAAVLLTVVGCAQGTPAVPSEQPSTPTGGGASATPATSASATATLSATVAPTDDTSDALVPGSIAQVMTTDLVVRSAPEISDASEIFEPSLNEPTLLYVVAGPVSSDGYSWYQVQPFGMRFLDWLAGHPFGWVAAEGRDGEPWIAHAAAVDCPDPDLDAIRQMSEVARLACYATHELMLEGEFAGCFIADPAAISPEWLTATGCLLVPVGYVEGSELPGPGGLRMRMSGEVGMPHNEPRARIVVTGHFDDPAAASCEQRLVGEVAAVVIEPMDPASVILQCRTEFVVTDVTPAGQ